MPWEKQFNTEEVLHNAMQAFWVRGYEATSMQRLVGCTGINRASIYAQFKDKRQLFLASLNHYRDRVLGERLSRLERQKPAKSAVQVLFEEFAQGAFEGETNRGCLVANTALELAAHDAQAREIVLGALGDLEGFFQRMVQECAFEVNEAIGVTATETDSNRAKALLASLLGMLVLLRSRPEQRLLQAVIDDACKRLTQP